VDSYAVVKERLSAEIESMSTSAAQNIVAELATLVKGGRGCSVPCTRDHQRRSELEQIVQQQLRAVLVAEEISSNKLTAKRLRTIRKRATFSRRALALSNPAAVTSQVAHRKRYTAVMKVPTRATPAEKGEIGEVTHENVLNREMLKDVLASGQAKLKEGSEKMREDVVHMCKGLSAEEASAFLGSSASSWKARAGGRESKDMIRYFGYLTIDE